MTTLEVGTWVERRHPRIADERFGRIIGHVGGWPVFYVTVAFGFTRIDQARNIRPADLPPSLTSWWTQR